MEEGPPPNSKNKEEMPANSRLKDESESIKTVINLDNIDQSCNASKSGLRRKKTINLSVDLSNENIYPEQRDGCGDDFKTP